MTFPGTINIEANVASAARWAGISAVIVAAACYVLSTYIIESPLSNIPDVPEPDATNEWLKNHKRPDF
ncbi:MAG: hypothetical protein AAB439_01305 [Patescibacteria group bacterium]